MLVDIWKGKIVHGSNELRICKGKIVQGDLADDDLLRPIVLVVDICKGKIVHGSSELRICKGKIVHGSNDLRICKGKIVQRDFADDGEYIFRLPCNSQNSWP